MKLYFKNLFILVCLIQVIFNSRNSCAIDCKRAKTKIEKAICNNKNLLQLDNELNDLYSNFKKKLSPLDYSELLDGQKSWMKFMNEALCFKHFYAECTAGDDVSEKAIEGALTRRIQFLKLYPQIAEKKLTKLAKIWFSVGGSLNNTFYLFSFDTNCSTHESGLAMCFRPDDDKLMSNIRNLDEISTTHNFFEDSKNVCYFRQSDYSHYDLSCIDNQKKKIAFSSLDINQFKNGTLEQMLEIRKGLMIDALLKETETAQNGIFIDLKNKL